MSQHGDELLAQVRGLALVQKLRLARGQPLACVEMKRDQLGEELEHPDRLGIAQAVRFRIDRAERAEEAPILPENWHRDVALEAVHRGRVVLAVELVLCDVIDNDRLAALAHLVADGGLDRELAAGLQAERDLILYRAADPPLLRDSRDRGEPHAGNPAHDVQDRRNGVDRSDRVDIRPEIRLDAHATQN